MKVIAQVQELYEWSSYMYFKIVKGMSFKIVKGSIFSYVYLTLIIKKHVTRLILFKTICENGKKLPGE